jgi:hypothetical protein
MLGELGVLGALGVLVLHHDYSTHFRLIRVCVSVCCNLIEWTQKHPKN